RRSKSLASLLSPAAFTFGADFVADYEYAGIGAGWGNWDEGEYSLKTSITMMFLDSVIYCMLAWYLDKVRAGRYHIFVARKPGSRPTPGAEEIGVEGDPEDFEPLELEGGGEGEGRGVVIKGLRKEFGSKVAVAGLDLRLRVGDITCLLGHNGAGKSTTISMLTGQLGATSGDAVVWGESVRDNLHKVK
ncbi:unnamed protein product, partial [Hapterophycus canaliculatus]